MEEKKLINNIWIIGKDLQKIKNRLHLLTINDKNEIEYYYKIFPNDLQNNSILDDNLIEQINNFYCDKVNKEKYSNDLDKITFSLTIIYSSYNLDKEDEQNNIKHLFSVIINNDDFSSYYQPFFIFLVNNDRDISNLINNNYFIEENQSIDIRNCSYFISPIIQKQNSDLIKEKIRKIFAYFFQFGDKFKIGDRMCKLYKDPETPLFSINILLLGQSQVGKSTFLNIILKEKKAKEGGEFTNVTDSNKTYHIDGIPLEITDIEGFTNEENINKAVNKIEEMQKSLKGKELHLVIYIIEYENKTYFNKDEYKIFEQLSKFLHYTKFLFVCSKAKEENNEDIVKNIRNSFTSMILKGKNETIDYLYNCQINFDELGEEINESQDRAIINKNKIKEIIKKENTLFFLNIKLDKDHNKIFGMKKISKKIRELFNSIKDNNLRYLKIQKEKKDIELQNIPDTEPLLKYNQKLNQNKYGLLINCIEQPNKQNIINAFNYAKSLKEEHINKIKEDLKNKKWEAFFWGILPLFDIWKTYKIKNKSKKYIAKECGDELIDFDIRKISKEEEIKQVKIVKKETQHYKNIFVNPILKLAPLASFFFKYILNFLKFGSIGIGTIFGMLINMFFMYKDINSFIRFYSGRLESRYLINLSFDKVNKYFLENFEMEDNKNIPMNENNIINNDY